MRFMSPEIWDEATGTDAFCRGWSQPRIPPARRAAPSQSIQPLQSHAGRRVTGNHCALPRSPILLSPKTLAELPKSDSETYQGNLNAACAFTVNLQDHSARTMCRRIEMKAITLTAALVVFSIANSAQAGLFGLFKHNNGCGCSSEPSCCAPVEASCCAPAEASCCAPAACGNGCGPAVEASCCAPVEATCCAPAACGSACEATCCAPADCCNTCGDGCGCNSGCHKGCGHGFKMPKLHMPKFKMPKFKLPKFKGHGCGSSCGSNCCSEPTCCAPVEASCCAPAACGPSCAAPCGGCN